MSGRVPPDVRDSTQPVSFARLYCSIRRALAVVVVFVLTAESTGQQVQNAQRRAVRNRPNVVVQQQAAKFGFTGPSSELTYGLGAMALETSPPILNLFQRAEEGIQRSDWKYAIDSLQRIIDDKEAGLIPVGDKVNGHGPIVYEPARRLATRRLASMPPEGLRAYRLLYDGRAKGLLERAREMHDADRLRQVVTRFAMTSYGDDAADLLASWALDEGRPAEAIAVLYELNASVPDYQIPDEFVVGKLAAAHAMLGRMEDARQLLAGFVARGEGSHGDAAARLREWLAVDRFPLLGRDYAPLEAAGKGSDWPMLGGAPSRTGRMDAVSPMIPERNPWQYFIPGTDRDAWREILVADASDGLRFPMYEAVASDGVVYVRTQRGCMALRADDLGVVWSMDSEAPTRTAVGGAGAAPPTSSAVEEEFDDHVRGAVSVAYGLVLLVERDETDTASAMGQLRRNTGRFRSWFEESPRPSRLAAYDAATGQLRWRFGLSTYRPGSFETVAIRSTPVPVDHRLWVPFLRDSDLRVGAIDPATGKLVQEISLGGVNYPGIDTNQPLLMAAGDGSLFVPSGRGVLFAVDTYQNRLRWAHQYTHDPMPGTAALPSPPVVTSGMVILAPADDAAVTAFDTATGVQRWRVTVSEQSHILGADERHLWLGGKEIICLRLSDGSLIWRTGFATAPTGRAIVTRDQVLAPTLDGVVVIDLMSGRIDEVRSIPGTQPPPGNLLSYGGSLYSIDASTVRRFPDLEQTYPVVLAQHQRNPDAVAGRLNLAWIELLRGHPERADELLSSVDEAKYATDPDVSMRLSQCRVEALLAIAHRGTGDTQTTLSRLLKASEIALTAEDRLRVELARAGHFSSLGKHRDAYDVLWSLGASPRSSTVTPVSDHVYAPARLRLMESLAGAVQSLSESERQEAVRVAEERVVSAVSRLGDTRQEREALVELRVLADLRWPVSAAQRSLLELGKHALDHVQQERAEQLLREVTRLEGAPEWNVYALQLLCELYGDRYWWTSARPLLEALRELETRFGDQLVAGNGTGDSPSGETVRDWIARRWGDVRRQLQESEAQDTTLGLTETTLWRVEVDEGRTIPPMAAFENEWMPALEDLVLISDRAEVVRCLSAESGRELWRAPLRFTNIATELEDNAQMRYQPPRRLRAVADGQVAVFEGGEALVAVGLATGRRLWAIAHRSQPNPDPYAPSNMRFGVQPWQQVQVWGQEEVDVADQGSPMAAGDGYFAYVAGIGRLGLLRMSDGTPVWERDLRGERVSRIEFHDDCVVTFDPSHQRAHVFERDTGRLRKRVLLKQPNPEFPIRMVVTEGTLCGATASTETDTLQGIRLAGESADPSWSLVLDKPVAQLFVPHPGFVGVGLVGGDVRIINTRTGEVRLDHRVAGAQAVVDGLLIGGTLLTRHNDVRQGRRYPVLSGLDIATGEVLWQRQDLAPGSMATEPLRQVGSGIPILLETDPQASRYGSGGVKMALIDAHTGVGLGQPVELLPPNSRQRLTGEVRFRGNAMVVSSDRVLCALLLEPTTTSN